MDDKIADILDKLNKGKINVSEAVSKIDCIKYKPEESAQAVKCAKKIKLFINTFDKETGKHTKINLPAISLKFIQRLGMFGIRMAVKFTDSERNTDVKDLKQLKFLIDALTMLPAFEIINVDSKDVKVHIYTC